MEMKTLTEELEELRIRMHDLATNEQDLVAALGDALNQADSKLLDDLRNLSSDHDARRAAIVLEIQRLASRLGTLPSSAQFLDAIATPVAKVAPFEVPSSHGRHERHERHDRHDRREHGTSSIAEELTKHLAARPIGNH